MTKSGLKAYFAEFENISFTEWDAAHAKLGGNWRMPTMLEFNQLRDANHFDWVWDNTRNGYTVTRKDGSCQGHSIFLPVDSGWRNGVSYPDKGTACRYMLSSPVYNDKTKAYYANINTSNYGYADYARYCGLLMRPVYDPTPDAVDLGLSVKWAKCNLDANSPEQNGGYYGWGCLTPYSADAVTWPLYFQKIGGTGTQESDCGTSADPLSNVTDIGVNPLYDAARSKLGGKWRIPTYAWANELLTLCDRSPVTNYHGTGINGFKIMSKVDKSVFLFLPLTGIRYLNSTSASNTGFGYFGVSNCAPASTGRYDFFYASDAGNCQILAGRPRPVGFPIRPVLAP
ncbi:MAG: hypothetical protein HUK19_07395 [Fibrobacter sp.]|nr:hypothetical protein [Fibrobacter sp.]